tara:strand:- start:772 stop:948 length:177 start_codon:yes stop_codon:yes gene_type:complete
MKYINRKDIYKRKEIETIDAFSTPKEAKVMLAEYRLSDQSGFYYISQRATKFWHKVNK